MRFSRSNNNYIAGCYFNDAQDHGNGGYGYGVLVDHDSNYNLIENNIFNRLRHAMLVQNDSDYNVFGYNKAINSKNTSAPSWLNFTLPENISGDIVCHGHSSKFYGNPNALGPSRNLFEGNSVKYIWVDSYWGKNELHNTFFRNKSHEYGMVIYPKLVGFLDTQNASSTQTEQITINNYLLTSAHWTDTWLINLGNLILWNHDVSFLTDINKGRNFSKKPIEKNNIVKRMNFWGNYYTRTWTDDKYGTDAVAWNNESYYLTGIPDFWPTSLTGEWPYHPRYSETIPAEARYDTFEKKTVSRYDDASFLQTYYITESLIVDDLSGDLYSNGNLRVPENTLLIIDSSLSENGITLCFGQDKVLSVAGSIIVKGSEDKPVTLTSRWNAQFTEWFGVLLGTAVSSEYGNALFEWTLFEKAANRRGNFGDPASFTENLGGAVNIRNDFGKEGFSVTFNNCTFRNNVSRNPNGGHHNQTGRGAAVYINSQDTLNTIDVLFSKCRFLDNTADGNNTYGGAIHARGNAPIIENCFFENNHATYGGAISMFNIYDTRTIFIAGNVFYSNSSARGGALYIAHGRISSSQPTTVLQNNTFVENTASSYGGGAYLSFSESQMVFINNLFRDNEAQGNHSVCGAGHSILIIVDSEVLDYPDIIFESNSIEGFNYINDQYNDYVSYARFSPSNYSFYNMNLNYISNNNIYNNPLLFDNYKIDNTSPCFDSGYQTTANEDDYIQYSLSHDVDGENRIAGLSIDIGAYEYNDICLMPSINEIVLGGINPDSPRRYKFNVANISNTQWVNNISFETTENLEDILQINAERSSLQPNSTMTVELNFYPNKMYQNYSGYIVINSDDILNTKMMIPFSANTHLHSGWNWVSFPLISGNVSDELLFDILNPHGLEIMDQNNSATYNNGIWDANEKESFL